MLLIHRFPEILITTVFLDEVKISRNYLAPKCFFKKETINKNIKNKREMLSTTITITICL